MPVARPFAAALFALGAMVGLAAAAPPKPATAPRPVLVELFTSQGCSSCPPADAVLARLSREAGVVVVSRPVTYWDRLGWKDTLASEANTELQRAYARRKFANAGVYTPQAVVNGNAGVVGSREAELRALVRAARARGATTVSAIRSADGGRTVTVSGPEGGSAAVTLLALDPTETVTIGRGENGGRKVTYTHVLKSEASIGNWQGGSKRFAVPAGALKVPGASLYAVVVRAGAAGPVLATRYI